MTTQARVREPAIAGQFYPADPDELRATVTRLLDAVSPVSGAAPPKALIAPHAGYPYSGPVAASAYARIRPLAGRIRRVVLLGPSHRVPFRGIATTTATAYRGPLGDVPVDHEALERIADLPGVQALDIAHGPEHSLEAHLPFLQVALGPFDLVPLVVGDASPGQVANVLDRLWGGPETLIVVSSDLSHFHDYATASRLDTATTRAIERLDEHALGPEQACGCRPLAGLLRLARQRGLAITTLDQRNSGDTAGPRDQVVGYGAWVLQ
ncbi:MULTISPECIES: AmmeMemoRadiSam system protein B [unclassified Thioalkalivibrio]|uniref:AmmeMemoRadiSam system protein B n=1 Tax=unclassified Thioalkalivibrio TaxID=2621013 RepID=UPI00037E8A34|nr:MULTISPECIES: AmmeMemoRadiSam system protein B [unclassified Thioalkalivibrio]